jgi:hypothetical protein
LFCPDVCLSDLSFSSGTAGDRLARGHFRRPAVCWRCCQSCLEAANGTAFVSCSSTLSATMPTTLRSSGPSSISTPPALARVSDRTPGGARIGRRRPAATDRAQVLQPAGHPVQLRDYEHVASAQMPEAVSNCGRRSKGPRGLVHVGVPRLEGSDCPNAVAVRSCCSVSVIFVQSA